MSSPPPHDITNGTTRLIGASYRREISKESVRNRPIESRISAKMNYYLVARFFDKTHVTLRRFVEGPFDFTDS